VSLGFNVFQLYRERLLRSAALGERKLHIATLTAIWKGLTESRTALAELHHRGAPADALEAIAARSLDSQRTQIAELLASYYGTTLQLPAGVAAHPPDDDGHDSELISGVEAITAAMVNAVEQAEHYIFAVGGRSRNNTYLTAVKQRVQRGDIRYVRTLTGDHIRHPLCIHLDELWGTVELGHLPEDKYGGILATHDTVMVALQSSTVGSLDKGLLIRSARIAADYRLHALELYSSSTRVEDRSFFKNLCTTCRLSNPQADA
jgi:hypothetical protein